MYHISKHVELMEKISEVNDDVLLIDTALAQLSGSAFKVSHERLDNPKNAVHYEPTIAPTWEAVRDLAEQFGYSVVALKPRFDNYEGSRGYINRRRAFLCAKLTDVSHVPAEIEPAPPGGWRNKREANKLRREAGKLEDWMRQTDLAVSELTASRRRRLMNALGDTGRRILRMSRGPTPEDRLLAIRNEFRFWLEEPGYTTPEKRGPNRSAGEPKKSR